MENQKQVIMVTSQFPTALERETRIAAAFQGVSKSELIRQAVTNYLTQLAPEAGREVATNGRSR